MTNKRLFITKNDFMKRVQLFAITLCMAITSVFAQRSYNFNAVALNVDGLPNKDISAIITTVNLNPDGKNEAGATEFCGILAKSGWDIVGFSEDFNFHDYIVDAPASTYYNFGKHSGSISTNLTQAFSRAKIDGLGIAVAKRLTFTGDTSTGLQVQWGTEYGGSGLTSIGDNGADNMITKGFRMYTVTFADGVAVDVYVLHMDAGTADSDDDYDSNGNDKNIVAREAQLKQLADHIKSNHGKRPVIIIGDTNCRYTREQLKTGFIDYINADSRFTIKDPWVEKIWGGAYPAYGTGALMTSVYGPQAGEVVDKVFYINTTESDLVLEANSYLHDTSIAISDHFPVVVNFTITDPNGAPLTDSEKEDNWTLEDIESGGTTNKQPTWEGEQVVNGTTYYIMNVGTGEYIKWGGAYYTEAVAGNGGTPITATTTNGGSTWLFKSSRGHMGFPGNGTDIYLDAAQDVASWSIEPVSGTSYQYRIKSSNGTYLTTTPSESHKPIRRVSYNANDDNQKWVFLTDDRIRTEMTKANADYPFNFTALLKSADFDVIELEDGLTKQNWTNFDWSGNPLTGNGPFKGTGTGWGADATAYSTYAYVNTTSAATMTQNLGTLPNGTYQLSFEGFYRAKYKTSSSGSAKEETVAASVKFGSAGSVAIPQNTGTNIGSDVHGLFKSDSYATSGQVSMSSPASVAFSVDMPATTGKSRTEGWICIDNFRLMYYGTGEVVIDPTIAYRKQVIDKVNETYEKVMQLNAAGQAAYDITPVIFCYNNGFVTSQVVADKLCAMVDAAYERAYAAHLASLEADSADGLKVHFTFENASSQVGEFAGKLYNNASFTTLGGLPVLSLGGNDGYFDMGSSVGDVIATLEDFTVSTNVYIPTTTSLSGNGNFLYTFANSTDIASAANGCIFFRAGVSDSRYAISTTHWGNEKALTVSQSPFTDGDWHTITYRQANGKGEIYVDGNLAVSGNISLEPKDLGATPYNFIGRPCYVGDAYLKDAMYHDFRIYKGAVDNATLATLTANLDALNTALYKMQIAALMAKITLGAEVLYDDVELSTLGENGITIQWSSSNESVVSTSGKVVRPVYGQPDAHVTLTATFTKGGVSDQKVFEVVVPAWEKDDAGCVQDDLDAIVLKGRLDNLMSNLYLPVKGQNGSTITWTSNAPDYLDANGELLKQDADKQKKVVLTATVTKGAASATREFTIKLAIKLPVKYYLFAYFNGNAQWQEQICFALSKDGYNYTPLNEGNPIINSSDIAKKKAVRDPHILRGADGYFYMVVTDMKSSEGWSSNDGLVLLRSKDMVNWTHSAIDFPTRWPHRFDRESLTQVWAPQTIYDPEEDKYMVYYAIGESGKNYITYYSYANEDFTDLTEPQVLYNHGGDNTIDADIVYYNGLYHMFFKTEGQGNGIQKATAKTLRGEWTPEYNYLQQTTAAVEGSGVFRLIDSDTWVLMYDCYTSGMYQYCTSTDLTNFTYKCNSANTSIFTPRHGTTMTITSEEACRLLNKWPCSLMFDIPLELYDTSEDDLSGIDGEYSSVTIHRPIKVMANDGESRAWSSMVLPVDLKADWIGDYEVKTLKSSAYDEATGELTLQFATVESMQAGVPYMVRYIADNTDQFANNKVSSISLAWKTSVDTKMRDTETEHITFKGVYARDYVPAGAFFISDNVFYQAATPETNRIKAFRAYLELNSNVASKVRSISYRMTEEDDDTPGGDEGNGDDNGNDDDTPGGDEGNGDDNGNGDDTPGGDEGNGDDNGNDDDTPGGDEGNGDDNGNVDDSVDSSTTVITSIAIYNTAGERLETMQVGLNILLMSDGSIIKVMVKE